MNRRKICFLCDRKEPILSWLFDKSWENGWRATTVFGKAYVRRFPQNERAYKRTKHLGNPADPDLCKQCSTMISSQMAADKASSEAAAAEALQQAKVRDAVKFEESKNIYFTLLENPDAKEIVLSGPDNPLSKSAYHWLLNHAGCEISVSWLHHPLRGGLERKQETATIYRLPYPRCEKIGPDWRFRWNLPVGTNMPVNFSGLENRVLEFQKNEAKAAPYIEVNENPSCLEFSVGASRDYIKGMEDWGYDYGWAESREEVEDWFIYRFKTTRSS